MRRLRSRRYDAVIDTQGLFLKSALLARAARGRRHGYDPNSVKEPFACVFYNVRHAVGSDSASARNRALTGAALGYTPDSRRTSARPRALAGSSPVAPMACCCDCARRQGMARGELAMLAAVLGADIDLVVPFGTRLNASAASRITGAHRVRSADRAPSMRGAALPAPWVGPTPACCIAAALGVPLIAIFSASEPGLTGPMGAGAIQVLGNKGSAPSVGEVAEAVGRLREPH